MTKARPITFGTVFLGLAFFCNPSFAAVDILPDFIGCLLICLGLSRAALVHPGIRESKIAFSKLAVVDACKNLALLLVFGMGSAADQPTVLLIVTFAATILELCFAIPAIRLLFESFYALASACDCTELYSSELGGASRTDTLKKVMIAFLFLREILGLLPEFAALATSTNSFNNTGWNRMYEYITLLRSVSFLLVGIASLIVAGGFLLWYYLHFRGAKAMHQELGERYLAYRQAHPGFAVERRHAVAFLFLLTGAILLVDFYLDFRNVFPDILAGLLLLVGILIPATDKKIKIAAAIAAVIYGAISGISSHFAYQFVSQYSADAISRSETANQAYSLMWITSLGEFLVFTVLLTLLLFLLRAVIWEWAGYRSHHAETLTEDEALEMPEKRRYLTEEDRLPVDHMAPDEQHQAHFETRHLRRLRAEFDGKLIRCFVFGFVSALFSFLFDYIKTMPGKGIYHLLEFTWVFDFCAAVIFAVLFGSLLLGIYREIQNRFRFDA
ncbi:MAG: hypothetical protein E7585_00370 [Ruminococcaceae bacterium]|nr:hypothetical protein [Oscillospiraceae bacterium]